MDEASRVEAEARPVPVLNIANVLTVLRILLVPVFLFVFFRHGAENDVWRFGAFIVFALAMLTDKIDGDLARRYGLITDFGKVADPVADKAQMGAALIALSLVGELWWAVTIVILARELGITLWRMAILRDRVVPASKGGKLKTALQTVAVMLYLLPLPSYLLPIAIAFMAAAVVATVWTGIDYLVKARRAA